MKKILLASAVAAATMGAQTASAMETASELAAMIKSFPSVYGNIQLVWAHQDADPGGSSTSGLADNGSTIGFKHDHEIAPGVTGFFKLELEGLSADDKADGGGLNAIDEAYIGAKGDFGQIWFGSDDSQYESLIDGIANYYEFASQSIGGSYSTGEGDLIQYTSPSISGLTIHGAVQLNGDGNLAAGDEENKSYPYQLGFKYSMDALTIALAMDSNDSPTSYNSSDAGNDGIPDINTNTYGLRAAYAMDNFEVSAEYQTRSDVGDVWGVQGVYSMGANSFAASYEFGESDPGSAEQSTITLQAVHNLSDHMYVYVEGYFSNNDPGAGAADTDNTDLALGGVYYF